MTLDRGLLATIDRRILSELDHAGGVQLAKIPLSDAEWSTWRRYCDVVGVTMGQGIAGLIVHEVGTVVDRDGNDGSVFGAEMERRLTARTEDLGDIAKSCGWDRVVRRRPLIPGFSSRLGFRL